MPIRDDIVSFAKRKVTNKKEKMAEVGRMSAIQKRVSKKVDNFVRNGSAKPKWGSGSEGLVVHPSKSNADAPRFKITSDAFRAFKADPKNKEGFKKRNAVI